MLDDVEEELLDAAAAIDEDALMAWDKDFARLDEDMAVEDETPADDTPTDDAMANDATADDDPTDAPADELATAICDFGQHRS
jgi:hypothetical protein